MRPVWLRGTRESPMRASQWVRSSPHPTFPPSLQGLITIPCTLHSCPAVL